MNRRVVAKTPSIPDESSLIPADQGECLELFCRQCLESGGHIRLEFAIGDDKRKLLVNGLELFPGHAEDHEALMTATVHDVGGNTTAVHEETVSYELSINPKGKDETEDIELIDVDYKIRQVGDRVVREVPAVHVRLIKLPGEDILIGTISTKQDYDADCSAMQCWAYKLSFGAIGSVNNMIPHCCSKSSSHTNHTSGDIHANHTSSDINWRPSPSWDKMSLPMLQLGLCSCFLLGLLAMFYLKCTKSSRKEGKRLGVLIPEYQRL
ncbi:hypothetical protein MY10362_009598 [Beauveria mimosiformis]